MILKFFGEKSPKKTSKVNDTEPLEYVNTKTSRDYNQAPQQQITQVQLENERQTFRASTYSNDMGPGFIIYENLSNFTNIELQSWHFSNWLFRCLDGESSWDPTYCHEIR